MSAIVLLIIRIALASLLYLFIGWVIYTIWSDINRDKSQDEKGVLPGISLKIINEQTDRIDYFSRSIVTIGRESTCDCIINDRGISSKQARLSFHHNQWWVDDLESTNGTYLNRERINQATVIINDDQLTCGSTTISISIGSAT